MFKIIETGATAVLLILVMIFVLHLIRGDAGEWLISKFIVGGGEVDTSPPSGPIPRPDIPNDPLPPPPSNQG